MAKKSTLKDIDHGWKNIQRQVEDLHKANVRIGIHADAGNAQMRMPDGSIATSDLTLAEVAFFNEFGTDKIPERPFIRTTADENKGKYHKRMQRELDAVFAGKAKVKKSLERLGSMAQADVRKKMKNLRTPPNAAETIKRKGSSNPLIDTATMLRAVDYEVKI